MDTPRPTNPWAEANDPYTVGIYSRTAWDECAAAMDAYYGERLAAAEAKRDDLHRQLTITKLREHQLQVDLAAAEREGVENCIVVASRRLAHDPVWPTLRAELAALSPLPDTEPTDG